MLPAAFEVLDANRTDWILTNKLTPTPQFNVFDYNVLLQSAPVWALLIL
jgi:hypothetical protein